MQHVTFSAIKGPSWLPRMEGLGDSDVRGPRAGTKYSFAGTWNAGPSGEETLPRISAVNTEDGIRSGSIEIFPKNPSREGTGITYSLHEKFSCYFLRCLTWLGTEFVMTILQ